jgi:hypothetical protein
MSVCVLKPENSWMIMNYIWYEYHVGARGGAVVEALRYKPESRVIDFRWCHWNFALT